MSGEYTAYEQYWAHWQLAHWDLRQPLGCDMCRELRARVDWSTFKNRTPVLA